VFTNLARLLMNEADCMCRNEPFASVRAFGVLCDRTASDGFGSPGSASYLEPIGQPHEQVATGRLSATQASDVTGSV